MHVYNLVKFSYTLVCGGFLATSLLIFMGVLKPVCSIYTCIFDKLKLNPVITGIINIFPPDHLACGDASWSYYSGSCYKLIRQHKSFLSAMDHCQAIQGYLVEIQDDFENRYVANFHRNQDIWIGLSDRRKEGHWIWETSGRVAIYTKWNPGEPNNKGGGNGHANCALIWRHYHIDTWDDRNCDQKKYFVCERGKTGSNIAVVTEY